MRCIGTSRCARFEHKPTTWMGKCIHFDGGDPMQCGHAEGPMDKRDVEIDRLKAEVESLKKALPYNLTDFHKMLDKNIALEGKADRLREALEDAIQLAEEYLSHFGSSKHCTPQHEDEIEERIKGLRRALAGGDLSSMVIGLNRNKGGECGHCESLSGSDDP